MATRITSPQESADPQKRAFRPWGMACLPLVLWLTVSGCRRSEPLPEARELPAGISAQIRNVLLVSLDTVRADYFGCYGYPHDSTPTIDTLAAEGVVFENAISPSPMTFPAHCSLLTGTNPTRHGVRQNIKYQLGPSRVTLAETLKEAGFVTAAFIASHVLDEKYGLSQGFDSFDDDIAGVERKAGEISQLASDWLDRHRADRFLLWLHYFDPHAPFHPPNGYLEKFEDAAHGRYAAEIAYADASLGSVLSKLRELDLYDSTLIVVVGDHGESLGEHGEKAHSYFIYQSTVRIPLVLKIPGSPIVKRMMTPVSLIDVLPTVCGLLEISPDDGVEGENLAAYCVYEDEPPHERGLYCESLTPTVYRCNPLLGLIAGDWKLIHTTRPELYRLSQDPHELKDVADEYPVRVRTLEEQLIEMVEASSQASSPGEHGAEIDQQTLRQLQSLGYVGGTVDEDLTLDSTRPDPKDLIGYHQELMRFGDLFQRRQFDEARQMAAAMIQQQPAISCGYSSLADVAMITGKLLEAMKMSAKALELNDEDVDSHYRMAVALHRCGELARAIDHYRSTLERSPDHVDAHVNLAKALQKQGALPEAIEHYREALRLNPEDPAAPTIGPGSEGAGRVGTVDRFAPTIVRRRLHVAAHLLSWSLFAPRTAADRHRGHSDQIRASTQSLRQ